VLTKPNGTTVVRTFQFSVHTQGTPESEGLSQRFEKFLVGQNLICDELETIADGLPHSVDLQVCLRTAQRLLPVVKAAHDFEEQVIFPVLKRKGPQLTQLAETLDRLRFEHWGDEEYALDINYALREYARRGDKVNIESLSWMLRGFFEGMRRHLAFDREYLLPIASEVMSTRCMPRVAQP
jgi:hypothetical protein